MVGAGTTATVTFPPESVRRRAPAAPMKHAVASGQPADTGGPTAKPGT